MISIRGLMAGCALVAAMAATAALRPGDRQVFLKVNPLPGESKTHSSGSGTIRPLGSSGAGSSKSVTRNMKWSCEVSYRGKPLPDKVEVKAFYIGYEGKSMTPKILKSETRVVELNENGRGKVELVSPTTRYSRSTASSTGSGRSSGGVRSMTTKVSGERIGGCVVQLIEDGRLVKSWASNSSWEKAAKDPAFNQAVLTRKDPHGLN